MESIQTTFSNTDEQLEIVRHESLSWFALVSVIFGVLSITALLYPGCWIFPGLATVSAMFSLWSMRTHEGIRGRGYATVGLTLGLLFGSWAVSEFFSNRVVIAREAREFSDEWLRLVLQNRPEDAHQLMVPPGSRRTAGQSLEDFYAIDPKAKVQREKFFGEAPVKQLLELGQGGRFRFAACRNFRTSYENSLVENEYLVFASDESVRIPLVVNVQRTPRKNSSTAAWQIIDVYDPQRGSAQ